LIRTADNLKAALKTLLRLYRQSRCSRSHLWQRTVPSTVTVAVPADANPLHARPADFDGKSWVWFGSHFDAANNVITARVSEVPQNVVVAQTAAMPASVA
jgi:hypothetical protein